MDQRLPPIHGSPDAEVKASLVPRKRKGKEGTKEERREAKRLKRLKQADHLSPARSTSPDALTVDEVSAKAAATLARKTEKARSKGLRTATGDEPTTILPGSLTKSPAEPDADAGAAPTKAERKAERARLKALKKTSRHENGDGDTDVVNGKPPPSAMHEIPQKPTNGLGRSTNTAPSQTPKIGKKTQGGEKQTSSRASAYQENPTLSALPQSEIDTFLLTNFITITDPTSSKSLRPIISFAHLPDTVLPKPSPFAAFKNPTPIQSAAWPFLLSGRDVIGVAETGSGKTLAFGLPCIRHISTLPPAAKQSSTARAVIVSPTRELAVQIYDQIVQLATPAGLKAVCVYGGVPKDAQRLALKTAHIVVATPGRLNDLINEGAADLSNVSYVVLDEADRMLDKGFEDEIRKIISTTRSPASSRSNTAGRQTLMFTATWPPSVRDLASTFMLSPVKIAIGDNPSGELRANASITQRVEVVDPYDKEQRLLQLLKQNSPPKSHTRILVFCLYKKEATRIENFLRMKGLQVAGIHGDLSQEKRSASLEAFKRDGGVPILVATDVAARGLDIPAVKVVINVTFPLTVEDYVHRIGRTGRAGATGLAITLFTEHDKAQSGALINVLKAAGQPVPDELLKFGTTVKKKGHEAYGAFYKDTGEVKAATKIRFD
ncbi:RNA-dependent ATPase [Xylographa trunciseda]|nr:RNA-dependent ATPase [Xylographa trunciseda]